MLAYLHCYQIFLLAKNQLHSCFSLHPIAPLVLLTCLCTSPFMELCVSWIHFAPLSDQHHTRVRSKTLFLQIWRMFLFDLSHTNIYKELYNKTENWCPVRRRSVSWQKRKEKISFWFLLNQVETGKKNPELNPWQCHIIAPHSLQSNISNLITKSYFYVKRE